MKTPHLLDDGQRSAWNFLLPVEKLQVLCLLGPGGSVRVLVGQTQSGSQALPRGSGYR